VRIQTGGKQSRAYRPGADATPGYRPVACVNGLRPISAIVFKYVRGCARDTDRSNPRCPGSALWRNGDQVPIAPDCVFIAILINGASSGSDIFVYVEYTGHSNDVNCAWNLGVE
jgi:hypothetical protein